MFEARGFATVRRHLVDDTVRRRSSMSSLLALLLGSLVGSRVVVDFVLWRSMGSGSSLVVECRRRCLIDGGDGTSIVGLWDRVEKHLNCDRILLHVRVPAQRNVVRSVVWRVCFRGHIGPRFVSNSRKKGTRAESRRYF